MTSFSTDTNPFFPRLEVRVLAKSQQLLSRTTCSRQHGQGHRVVHTQTSSSFLGRQLIRHLLPFLLGFKFNLVSLIPLLFGLLLIISKKALLLAKVAFFISGLLGWTSIYNAPQIHYPSLFNGFMQYDHPHESLINNNGPLYDHYHNFQYRSYRVPSNVEFIPHDRHVVKEVVDVYDGSDHTDQTTRVSKNFAWT